MTLYILFGLAICGAFAAGVIVGSRGSQGKLRKLERKLKQMEAKAREGRGPLPTEESLRREPQPCNQPVPSERPTDTSGSERTVSGTGHVGSAGKTGGSQEISPITRDQWYQKFGQAGTLAVHFNYSFPDKMYFQSGTGFIRNARNQVIPNKTVFSTVNTATGYAMEGLFWVFNVIYRGREYTFQEIMDGQMTTGYVRIEGIPALTVVEPTGVDGCYRLIQKGKLKIVDV